MKYSDAQVKAYAGKKWLSRNRNRFMIQLGLCIIWVVLVKILATNVNPWVWIAPFVLVIFNGVWSYYRARNKFLARYKKNPEIIK